MTEGYKHPICIIGMHRSGTSMVARLLRLCGLDLGPEDVLMGASANNTEGHFEHLGFLEINEALLDHLGASWDNPPAVDAGWERSPSLEMLTQRARDLIATFSGSTCWGWKDPRTTLLLPFWRQLIPNMRYVICMRNPLEVGRSLAERDRMSIVGASDLWYHYSRKALRDTGNCPRVVSFYDDYFDNPLQEFNRVAEFCGFAKHNDPIAVQGIISRELRHQSTGLAELLAEDGIPLEYKFFYLGLRTLCFQEAAGNICEQTMANTGDGAESLLQLMEKFRRNDRVAQLEAELAGKEQLLNRTRATIGENEWEIANLKQANSRLTAFSDAVRSTWAYRAYRTFIKRMKGVSE